MSLENFKFLKVIGKGSYGEVWLTQHKKDKKQYVLKKMTLRKASKRERKSAEQEAKLLSRLKHPNIVSYKDSFETDDCYLYIAMQFCEGGDLYARLKEQKGTPLEERQVVEWFVQIAMALQYLHERNILHRDLKTQNIFLTKSKIIKVGDLGIARVLETSNDMATTLIGTPYYMSPELFTNKPYNHKSDVWALGCCVYEMATLKHAFNAKDMNSLVYKILKGRMPAMPKQYSNELVTLIKAMLHQHPDQRPSVNKILKDPYIKKNIAIFLEETRLNHRPTSARPRPRTADRLRSAPVQSSGDSSKVKSDVTDGPAPAVQPQVLKRPVSSGGDAPASQLPSRPVPTRRSSIPSKPDLEPIIEGSASQKSPHHSSDSSENQDTIVSSSAKEAHPSSSSPSSPTKNEKPAAKKKNNFLQNKAKSSAQNASSETNGTEESKVSSRKQKSYSVFSNPKPVETPRPLPVPQTKSGGLPRRREDCIKAEELSSSSSSSKSSSVSSSKEDNSPLGEGETPRSLPNLSARERRRQKNPMSNSAQDRPDTARLKLRKQPERNTSERVTKAEKSEFEPQKAKHLIKKRQPSIHDSSSSTEEDTLKNEDEGYLREKEKKNEKKEMNNFISILDNTLRNMKVNDNSDEDTSPLKPIPDPIQEEPEETRPVRRSTSMPSAETLCNTGRLLDRIKLLHKDCVEGVGFQKLHKAYEILDRLEDEEVEPQLVELLGKHMFDEYAGRIWQLKFCEESLYKL